MKITELLGKMLIENTDVECWYDFDDKCIKLKLRKWESTFSRSYGVIIEIDPEDILLVPEAQPYSEWTVLKTTKKDESNRTHKCEDFIPKAMSVDYDWYKHTYDDSGDKIGTKHNHYTCKICGREWCELGNPLYNKYKRVLIDESGNFVIRDYTGE